MLLEYFYFFQLNECGESFYGLIMNPIRSHEFSVWGIDQYIQIYDRRMMSIHPFDPEDHSGYFHGIAEGGCLKKLKPSNLPAGPLHLDNFPCSAQYSLDGMEIIASYRGHEIYLFQLDGQETCEKKMVFWTSQFFWYVISYLHISLNLNFFLIYFNLIFSIMQNFFHPFSRKQYQFLWVEEWVHHFWIRLWAYFFLGEEIWSHCSVHCCYFRCSWSQWTELYTAPTSSYNCIHRSDESKMDPVREDLVFPQEPAFKWWTGAEFRFSTWRSLFFFFFFAFWNCFHSFFFSFAFLSWKLLWNEWKFMNWIELIL